MPEDANVDEGLISTASPIGRALLNKEEGDEVIVKTPERHRAPLRARQARDHPRRHEASAGAFRVITSDSPDRPYSTRLRTALVLTGTGTAGAYHAGVLRALHEAGVRIDLVAGRGIGAVGAMFAAVDGGQRLWDPAGLWKQAGDRAGAIAGARRCASPAGRSWPPPALLAVPLALLAVGVVAALVGRAAVAASA